MGGRQQFVACLPSCLCSSAAASPLALRSSLLVSLPFDICSLLALVSALYLCTSTVTPLSDVTSGWRRPLLNILVSLAALLLEMHTILTLPFQVSFVVIVERIDGRGRAQPPCARPLDVWGFGRGEGDGEGMDAKAGVAGDRREYGTQDTGE